MNIVFQTFNNKPVMLYLTNHKCFMSSVGLVVYKFRFTGDGFVAKNLKLRDESNVQGMGLGILI